MSPDGPRLLFGSLPKQLKFTPEEKRILKNFARILADRILRRRGFSCLLTGDAELRRLNYTFLNHDYPTDVLSFPSAVQNGQVGEIAISVQRSDAQAGQFGHSRLDEIRILMLHGVLHLAGMDHQSDLGEMARAEEHWRKEFGLPPNLIARAGMKS